MKTCRTCKQSKPEDDFYRMKEYRQGACKVCMRAKTKEWNDKFRTPERSAQWAANKKAQAVRIKDAVFGAYGGYVCACCGETERKFLSLDHINNDGGKWRKDTFGARNYAGKRTYAWLHRHGYPPGIQVLCMNCNHGKSLNGGVCPHLTATCNDYPLVGVGSSDPKRSPSPNGGDDIVSSVSKDAAVH